MRTVRERLKLQDAKPWLLPEGTPDRHKDHAGQGNRKQGQRKTVGDTEEQNGELGLRIEAASRRRISVYDAGSSRGRPPSGHAERFL